MESTPLAKQREQLVHWRCVVVAYLSIHFLLYEPFFQTLVLRAKGSVSCQDDIVHPKLAPAKFPSLTVDHMDA